jgi:hypothetical protein
MVGIAQMVEHLVVVQDRSFRLTLTLVMEM